MYKKKDGNAVKFGNSLNYTKKGHMTYFSVSEYG